MDPVATIESSLEAFLDEDPTLSDEVVEVEVKPKEEPEVEQEESTDEPEEGTEEDPEVDPDEEESEEEEQEEPDTPAISDDTLIDITIGDEEYEVNLTELKSGYLRNEDYVNKVQAQDQAFNEKLSALEVREAELAEELRIASVVMTGDLSKYERINWQALKEQDPDQYKTLRLEAIEASERVNQAVTRRKGIEAMHKESQRLRHEAYVKTQVELANTLVPGFNTPEGKAALVKHALDLGYTEDDVMSISDARHLLLLNNSRLLTEGVVRKKEALDTKRPAAKLPPVVKPGQSVANPQLIARLLNKLALDYTLRKA